MRRTISFLLFVCFFFGCSSHTTQNANVESPGKAKLLLTALPRQGFVPLRVTFHATLQQVSEQDKDFYCQKEEWDFGDGSISSEQPHCEPFTSETKITTEFITEHVYEIPGNYTAGFTLGDKKLRSAKVGINCLESLRSPTAGR